MNPLSKRVIQMSPIVWIARIETRTRFAVVFLLALGAMAYRDFVSLAQTLPPTPSGQSPVITDQQRAFFEAKIRPVLVTKCYSCHSAKAKEVEDELLLDTPQGVRKGGVDGAIIVPGNPDKSLLIQALRYTNKDIQMPPDDGGGKLPDSVISDFVTWVKMGAPDPRDAGPLTAAAPAAPKVWDTTAARKWWAFQQLQSPMVPAVVDSGWSRGDIDKFVFDALAKKNIKPVADADKTTLIRRVYFDLIGLPPTPAQVDAFVNDGSPEAYQNVVDTLLASPQFGEHWGRHWLDVARYAESTGKDLNVTFPNAWRYRDYVINSFNNDKPYNEFVREQIAGDLLPAEDPTTKSQMMIATGFLAIGPKGLDEQVPRQFALDLADEQVDATSQAFLGLTVSCARCHDHKFDPIMQRDYYAMAGIFLSTKTDFGTIAGPRNLDPSDLLALPDNSGATIVQKPLDPDERTKMETQLAQVNDQIQQLIAQRREQYREARDNGQQPGQGPVAGAAQIGNQLRNAQGQKAHLEAVLNEYDEMGNPKALCMGVHDLPPSDGPVGPMPPIRMGPKGLALRGQTTGFETIADSPLFFRGEMSDPRDRIPRGFPAFLLTSRAPVIAPDESGRRELADWIISPWNPLTARVMSNRIWYWLFGQGIVASVDNFGTMGDAPSNQALLDHLACRLIENRWSIKQTIREIVLSHAYQLSGNYDDADFAADPGNTLTWRHSKRRLNAECIRDAMLQASNQLNLTPPAGSPVALAGDGSIGSGPAYERINETVFAGINDTHRSVYLPVARDEIPDALAVFDYPDSTVVHGDRETTNVPSQGLYMLNNDFVHAQAKLIAQQIVDSSGSDDDRLDKAFNLILCRPDTDAEHKQALAFLNRIGSDTEGDSIQQWTDFCLALFNTAEFRYLN
jgi:hypothetical protein